MPSKTADTTSFWKAWPGFAFRTEIDATTPFRQVEADFEGFADDPEETLSYVLRADFEGEAKRFAEARGISLDWDAPDQTG